MSFLLSNCKELGFDGLVAVNGGCNRVNITGRNGIGYPGISGRCTGITNPPPYTRPTSSGSGGIPVTTAYNPQKPTTTAYPTNVVSSPISLGDGYGADKRGYWATLEPTK